MFEIGNTLREARLHRRIDLVEAEADTKIRSKYLAALETEEFDVLPGVVYTRGFLRTYSRYLGLDPQLYIDEYNSRFGRFEDAEGELASRLGSEFHDRPRRRMVRTLLVVSVVALALLLWIGMRSEAPTTASVAVDESEQPSTTGGIEGATTMAGTEGQNEKGAAGAAGADTEAPTPGASPSGLVVRARGAGSWVEIRRTDERGPILFSGELAKGVKKRFDQLPLHVTAGAPAGVELVLGDKTVRGRGADVVSWSVTTDGIAVAR